jgi:site-specific recombinase XerD
MKIQKEGCLDVLLPINLLIGTNIKEAAMLETKALQKIDSQEIANPALHADFVAAQSYMDKALSDNTRKNYDSAFRQYQEWCQTRDLLPLPVSVGAVASYISHLADNGRAWSSIDAALAALSHHQAAAGHVLDRKEPRLAATIKGIQRTIKTRPEKRAPIVWGMMREMIDTTRKDASIADSPRRVRDRALLLLGWAGGFRRSELTQLRLSDIVKTKGGIKVYLRQSKTNQEGRAEYKPIVSLTHSPYCPVKAVNAWLDVLGEQGIVGDKALRTAGGDFLFWSLSKAGRINTRSGGLSDRSVHSLVREYLVKAGFDPKPYGAHSLRSGLITELANRGVPVHSVQTITGHRDLSVLMGYAQEADAFAASPLPDVMR